MNIPSDGYYCYASPVSFSDHYAVTLNKRKPQNKGPRPWRFPVSILSDPLKQQSIRDRLTLFNEHNPIHSWELIKSDIQQIAREITAFSQKQS